MNSISWGNAMKLHSGLILDMDWEKPGMVAHAVAKGGSVGERQVGMSSVQCFNILIGGP
jgi:hypothetical protein